MSRSSETVSALPRKVDRRQVVHGRCFIGGRGRKPDGDGLDAIDHHCAALQVDSTATQVLYPYRRLPPCSVSLKAARAWISPKFFRSSTCGLIIDQPDARYGRTREASRDPTILRRLVWRRAGHAAAPREKLLPEAELRLRARTLNEHIDSVSLYAGEEGEKQHLITELKDVLRIMRQIVGTHHTAYVHHSGLRLVHNHCPHSDRRSDILGAI